MNLENNKYLQLNPEKLELPFISISEDNYELLKEQTIKHELTIPQTQSEFVKQLPELQQSNRKIAILFLSFATVCRKNETFEESNEYNQTAILYSKNDPDIRARATTALGGSCYRKHQYREAKHLFEESLKSELLPLEFHSMTLSNLGLIYMRLDDLKSAKKYTDLSLGYEIYDKSPVNYFAIRINAALIYKHLESFARSRELLQGLTLLNPNLKYKSALFSTYNNLCSLDIIEGNYQDAINSLEKAKEFISNDRQQYIYNINLGELNFKNGNKKDAISLLEITLHNSDPAFHLGQIVGALEVLIQIYKNLNDYRQLKKTILKYRDAMYSLINQKGIISKFEQKKMNSALEIYSSLPKMKTNKNNDFQHFDGDSWKTIKHKFVYNFIMYHLIQTKISNKLFEKMGMTKTNYFVQRERLAKKGYTFPNYRKSIPGSYSSLDNEIQNYITRLNDKTYNSALNKFEEEFFMETFKRMGYSRKKLSEKLKVSYPVIVSRLKRWIENE